VVLVEDRADYLYLVVKRVEVVGDVPLVGHSVHLLHDDDNSVQFGLVVLAEFGLWLKLDHLLWAGFL
jgi:hypothetical protein